MSLLDFFLRPRKENTAKVAKERLQIIVAHERSNRSGPDYLPQLKQDLLDVIRKYVDINPDQVSVQLDKKDDLSVLELNIMLNTDLKPEGTEEPAKAAQPEDEKPAVTGEKS
jgi:cell division topological specificity factor